VGSRADNSYVLEGDFAEYPVSLADLSSSAIQEAANTLENYAEIDGISPVASGKTDENGEAVFGNLEKGLYLISGESVTIDDVIYTPAAALVEISADENGSYDLSVYPKFELNQPEPAPSEYSVKKIWSGDSDLSVRPDSVTVDIYNGETLAETVTLDESNDWSYSWTSADSEAEWRVEEQVPEGYTVVYREDGAAFEIENTYQTTDSSVPDSSIPDSSAPDSSTPDTSSDTGTDSNAISSTPDTSSTPGTTSSTPEKIPQTGQLWWPVPILSAAGIVLVAIGWRLHVKKESDK
jgi:hypothetical protein